MLSKWMNDFDLDKDKTRLKLLDINLWWFQSFALILDPGHLMTKISWLAWDVHMYNVQYQGDEHQESDHQDADKTAPGPWGKK